MKAILPLALLSLLWLAACSEESNTPAQEAEVASAVQENSSAGPQQDIIKRAGAPLLNGLGDFNHTITTADPWVQRYFNQGMIMAAGFNHAEAVRAFKAAQTLEPECAMCYWGEALAIGPNINVTSKGKAIMMPADRTRAHTAIQTALTLAESVSEREQDLINAQATRYNGDAGSDRAPLDRAYADAMRTVAAKYPLDDGIQAMFAEALMNTMPWDYWLDGENPKPETAEVITALETVMARNPSHPLTLHLYIHAVEASSRPGRAEAAADQLADLVPGSGHLVHMPSHIYWRIGRYFDASEANVRAAKVDEEYIAQCNAQGFYPALYYPHNIHFLWASASMEGRSAVAIEAGRKVAANVHMEQIQAFPTIEFFKTVPLLSLVRFGLWDDIIAEPQPPESLKYSTAIWRYARTVALARKNDVDGARTELAAMAPLIFNESIWSLDGNDYPASQILSIAHLLAQGEVAQATGEYGPAIAAFAAAVDTQDELPYTEPPFWYYPTRQSLGQVLMLTGDHASAESVYRADLAQYPRNGWSMYGLSASLDAQGKTEEAAQVKTRFKNIWARADVELKGSVL